MNIRAMYATAFILACIYPAHSTASDAYKCEMKMALTRSAAGLLSETGLSPTMVQMNKEFIVDRRTGRILGGKGIGNYNEGYGEPKVIDPGSSEQAFKVLTVYRPNVSVAYLEVEEFASSPDKPFTFVSAGSVYSGLCRHY